LERYEDLKELIMPKKNNFEDPTFENDLAGEGIVPYAPVESESASRISEVLRRHEARLMAIPGVKSIGEGSGSTGEPAIEVGLAHAGAARLVPHKLEGIEVVTRVVGEVDAYAGN
jgi:hypothetical protein